MKYILTKNDTCVIHYIGDTCVVEDGIIDFGNIKYNDNTLGVTEVQNVPADVLPLKYCFNETDGFYLNNNYVEPNQIESTIENLISENNTLKSELVKANEMIEELAFQILMIGGTDV